MKTAKRVKGERPSKTVRKSKPKTKKVEKPVAEKAPEPEAVPLRLSLRDNVVITYGKSEVRGQIVYLGEAFDVAKRPNGRMRSDARFVPHKGWVNAGSRWQYIKMPAESGGMYTVCRGVIVRGHKNGKVHYWSPWPSQVQRGV